ncbi:MAG: hypothetical protein CR994_06645 [Maribacter sp.]|nr:MAG: hypothetical protein CR994_06645 [Maribacter sp.]
MHSVYFGISNFICSAFRTSLGPLNFISKFNKEIIFGIYFRNKFKSDRGTYNITIAINSTKIIFNLTRYVVRIVYYLVN